LFRGEVARLACRLGEIVSGRWSSSGGSAVLPRERRRRRGGGDGGRSLTGTRHTATASCRMMTYNLIEPEGIASLLKVNQHAGAALKDEETK